MMYGEEGEVIQHEAGRMKYGEGQKVTQYVG